MNIIAALLLLLNKPNLLTKCIILLLLIFNIAQILFNMEGFTDESSINLIDAVKEFTKGDSMATISTLPNTVNQNELITINDKIEKLNNNISILLGEINNIDKTRTTNAVVNSNNSIDILTNIEVYKKLQLQKLVDLQAQLDKAKKQQSIINMQATTAKYKPIPVYNSCVIHNADGTMSN